VAHDNRTLEEQVRNKELERQKMLDSKREKLLKDREASGAKSVAAPSSKVSSGTKKVKKKKSAGKKSGLREMEPGEVLFVEGDIATSLFIIQKGQLRLYRPKGKGYVELAILRSGEVLGEMAYFEEGARRRSCSAASIITTSIVEISFDAFGHTMQSLNPWFKTIINTLAKRLRTTNEKVKELESNSVGYGQDGHVAGYKFFHNVEIIRMLSLFYLVFRAHGKRGQKGTELSLLKLRFYMFEVMGIAEVKFEEFLPIMVKCNMVMIESDEDNLPNTLISSEINLFKSLMGFFAEQKMLTDDKKTSISSNCEIVLRKLIAHCDRLGMHDQEKVSLELNDIFNELTKKGVTVDESDLDDATQMGFCTEVLVNSAGKVTTDLFLKKLRSDFLALQVGNAVARVNEAKASSGSY
jgi:CRP/FNR family transcriptional regulator, cyclic AMP receptor protein